MEVLQCLKKYGQRLDLEIAVYPYREIVEAGGLMSYGASLPDMWRRADEVIQ